MGTLLESKLHVPRRRSDLVARPRLSQRLRRAAESPLTLVSAPAGFGKTTLLAEWVAAAPTVGALAAWVSLDERDNDPALFWAYVVAALQAVVAGEVGAGVLALLQPPQPPVDVVLGSLVNDLHAVVDDVVLVLDDYHVIEARDVQQGMVFLLDNLPPHVHLVIAGRADPELPLARLRARGDLVEIRAADLRFTPDESAAYLNGSMGLALTSRNVEALESRTEGWIAALQLAALSLEGRDDLDGFISGFAGDDRYIVDYLTEEVLQRQPEDVHHFLLETSILDRLSGPLCDMVTGRGDGKARLAALDRGNLFLVPLDDRRRWYRYHHLFAEVLQAHLLDEQPDDVADLHRRASAWFEQHDEPSEAIRHALAAGDYERAASLMELALPALRRSRREPVIRGWLTALPEEVVRVRPVLRLGFVGALASAGEFEGVEGQLKDVERLLDTATGTVPGPRASAADMVVVDEQEFRLLPGTIEMYRAAMALVRGDVLATVTHARRAIDLSPEGDHLPRAGGTALVALASWTGGDLDAAHQAYAESMAMLQRAGHVSDVLGCALALADIRLAQGRLNDALHTYERGLQHAAAHGRPVLRGTADMHVGMSEVLRERNDLPAATQHLLRSRELGEHTGLPQQRYRWRVAMAGVRRAEGDLDGAIDLLNEADRLYVGDFSPNVRPVPALRARLHAVQGALGDAVGWARERALSVDDDLTYLHEFDHITLARVLLAQHTAEHAARSIDEATRLLRRLLAAAEQGDRTGSVIEILVLQAVSQQMRSELSAALGSLERALTLAEPEGYVRVFADEGAPMASLLKAAAKQGISPSYVRRLLTATGSTEQAGAVQPGLVEPLSARELEVLRLLGTDLGGPDIARELVVSLNTVRTHTKHIYAKLGVNNRRAAVRRGESLNLL